MNKDNQAEILYRTALCLHYGVNMKKGDVVRARQLYLKNWEENRHPESGYQYAELLRYKDRSEPSDRLARKIYFENWKANKHSLSLYQYAGCLKYGKGGEKNIEEANRLMRIFQSLKR